MTLNEIIEKRKSIRNFSDEKVPDEKINAIVNAAITAPSSYNEQPWRLILALKEEPLFNIVLASLSEWNQQWAKNASFLAIALAKKYYTHNQKPNIHAWYDLGQFIAYFTLKATEMGLFVHQIGGFSDQYLRENLKIDDQFDIVSIVALGYKSDTPKIEESIFKLDKQPRTRKSMDEVVGFNDVSLVSVNNILP